MSRTRTIGASLALGMCALAVLATRPARAAEAATGADPYQQILKRDFGTDDAAMDAIRQEVQAAKAADCPAIEAKLLAVVESAQATWQGKEFACRMLKHVGSDKCVPALTKLLGDEHLSHMARFVLAGVAATAAEEALIDAAGKTTGPLRIGMIATLGQRGSVKALPVLSGLLGQADLPTALSALNAIGKIGGTEAAEILAKAKVPQGAETIWCDASLACAEGLIRAGQNAPAETICQAIFEGKYPSAARAGAFGLLVQARKAQAVPLIFQALKSGDRRIAQAAGAAMIDVPGTDATKALAGELANLPAEGKVVVLNALASRADPAGCAEAINKLVADAATDWAVRLAAARALATAGNAESVGVLAGVLKAEGDLPAAARQSLLAIQGEGVVDAMIKLAGPGGAATREAMFDVLAKRSAASAAPAALAAAGEQDKPVRQAALRALAVLAGPGEVPKMVDLLLAPKDESDRDLLVTALGAVVVRVPDRVRAGEPVLAALPKADEAAKGCLFAVLQSVGGDQALAAVKAGLAGGNADLRRAAIRALGEWRDAAPMAELLPIARSDADAAAKVLALRGYIRMIGLAKAPLAERLEQCRQALSAAARPEEKRLALAALADVPHLGALKLVQANMADAAVANEAIAACVKIADALLPASPEEAGAALKELAENAKDPRVRDQAKGAMLKVRKAGGAIKTWLLSGPYLQKDKDGSALFDVAFPPESPDAKDVKWTVAPAGDDGKVDLNAALGGENRVAYLRTIVVAPKAGKAILAVGSDDGVKVFLNGKMVHGINASRGCEPDQDKVDIVLKEGDNDLLLKVVNFGDGWAAMARICGPQGQEMKELKYKTK